MSKSTGTIVGGFIIAAIGVAVGYGVAVLTAPPSQWEGEQIPRKDMADLLDITQPMLLHAGGIDCDDMRGSLRFADLCAQEAERRAATEGAHRVIGFLFDHGLVDVPE